MKRFKEFLVEGNEINLTLVADPKTTSFRELHRSVYGDKSERLIADAIAAQKAAEGNPNKDISGTAAKPEYETYGASPIQVYRLKGELPPELANKANRPIASAQMRSTTPRRDPKATVNLDLKDPEYFNDPDTKTHEGTHNISGYRKPYAIEYESIAKKYPQTLVTPKMSKQQLYLFEPEELPAYQSGYEAGYYTATGKILDSSTTEKDVLQLADWGEKSGKMQSEHIKSMRENPKFWVNLAQQTAKVNKDSNRQAPGEGTIMA